MKFKRIVINGKEYYERVEDTAENTEGGPEVIDAEIEDGDGLSGAEKFMRDTGDFFDRLGNGAREFGDKFVSGAKELGERIKSGTERLFSKDKSADPKSREAKLLKILPYLSREEKHSICDQIIADDEIMRGAPLDAIMPFLERGDADRVFDRSLELMRDEDSLVAALKYISEPCATRFTDGYINGKYPNINIDKFYPFLSDANIKRLFYHIITSTENA